MRKTVIVAAMSLCLVSLAPMAAADTLIMRDGTRVDGSVVGIKGRTITFRHADGVSRRYFTSQVEGLEFVSAERANPRAASGRTLHVPGGTQVGLRMTETIDSRNAGPDQLFTAIVEEPAVDLTGRVIIPEGSSAQLIIRQISPAGTKGSPEMVLDIHSIAIEGRRYLVSATEVAVDDGTGLGKYERTAQIVGAVGGAGVQFSKGRDVRLVAETAIMFRLDKPITLQAAQ